MPAYNLGPGHYRVTVSVQRLRSVDGQSGGRVELRRVREDGHYWSLTTFAGKIDFNLYKRTFSLTLDEAESFDVVPVGLDGEMVDFWFDITFEHDPLAGLAGLPLAAPAPAPLEPYLMSREEIAVKLLTAYVASLPGAGWDNGPGAKVRVDRCFELADEVIRRRKP